MGWSRALAVVLTLLGVPAALQAAPLPAPPSGWSATLQLGVADPPGGAARLAASAAWGFRYQYLSGGTGNPFAWRAWNQPDGAYVTAYVAESAAAGIVPVFSYYMLREAAPGNALPEADGVLQNLVTADTMRAYFEDLKVFFARAGAFPGRPIVLHVEPDLWGYAQRRAAGDVAATVPALAGGSGLPELDGLPDTVSGFAQAIVRLRDRYAPNVLLAYHLSVWGTGMGIAGSALPDATVDDFALRAAQFFASLEAAYDLVFAEFSDRDAGFYQYQLGDGGAAWWDAEDFHRMARFLGKFVAASGRRVVMWQIPLGNTRMRAMNNTWNHYQDNRVEWFLDDPGRAHLLEYVEAGVIAFLFGRGADGATCACDAAGDGITDPSPISGNTGLSSSADDDGGFFRQVAAAYYQGGAMPLPPTGAEPPPGPGPPPGPAPGPPPSPAPSPLSLVTGPGAGGAPLVRVLASVNGSLGEVAAFLAYDPAFAGGVSVAAGDVEDTPGPEIVVAPGPGGGPHVRIFRSDGTATGTSFMAYTPNVTAGLRIATCDLDGDGRDEIVTAPGPAAGPHVRVWSLAGGAPVEVAGFMAYDPSFSGGLFVACADVDGDGRAEIITGADAGGGPHVRVWSLSDGITERFGFFAFDPAFRGGVRVAAADLDGDGRATIVVAPGPGGGPHVRAFRLVAGALAEVASFYAYDPAFGGGVHVAAAKGVRGGRIVTGPGAGGGPHVRVFTAGGVPIDDGFLAYPPAFTGGVTVAAW
jgi:hypothetical protein